jgi:hypothetical protein
LPKRRWNGPPAFHQRAKCHRHAIAKRDRAGLIKKQNIDVASRFNRAAAGGENILPDEPVNSTNADGAE